MKIMGKNIKSYATTQVHSPGKGREALRQKAQIFQQKKKKKKKKKKNIVQLNCTHSFLKLQAKFSNLRFVF